MSSYVNDCLDIYGLLVNPSGARRLYESVGFQTTHTQIAYVKDIAG
ncbi:hypothetical protein [Coleofasciculus chthonoplastes]|nr:hypothetical protein [Coleofasciculus chthonoplastes]